MLADLERRHENVVAMLALATACGLWLLGQPSLEMQVVGLSLGVLIFGVPHGALDHRPAKRLLLGDWGSRWWLPFVLGYVALAAAVFAAFALWPRLSLSAFLMLSIVHFGLDAPQRRSGPTATLRLMAWGAPGVVLPMALHSADVSALFSWVAASPVPQEWVARVGAAGLVLWLASLLLLIALRTIPKREVVRLVSYIPLFAIAPPLVAFAVFFCLDHSLRHLLDEAFADGGVLHASLKRLCLEALPATLATAAGALVLAKAWFDPQAGLEPTLVRVLFQGLAALTLPHMLLTWASDTRCSRLEARA